MISTKPAAVPGASRRVPGGSCAPVRRERKAPRRFGDPLRWPGDANVSAAPGSPGRFFQRHEDGSAGAFALEEFADCLHHQIVIVLLRKP